MRWHRAVRAFLVPIAVGACARPGSTPTQGAALDVADAALANGAPALALSVSQTEAARRPGDAQVLLREARAFSGLHRWAEARAAYDRALAIDPALQPANMELGRLILSTDPTRAAALFGRVVSADSSNAAALNDRGIALDLLGSHGEAQRSYREAIGADPDSVAAEVNLALSVAIVGNPDEAVRLMRPIAAGPSATPRIRQDLAFLLVETHHDEEAIETLRGDMSPDEASQEVAHDRAVLWGERQGKGPE